MKAVRTRAIGKPGLAKLVWPFVAVVLAQTLIASLSIYTLSAVRGYVGGESLWSKGYKDAVHTLEHYAQTGRNDDFHRFQAAIAVPLADRDARLALDRPDPDIDAARLGFLGGGIHADDVDGLIWLFLNFRNVVYLAQAIDHWAAADPKIVELAGMAESIRQERTTMLPGDPRQVERWKARIDRLNDEITPLTLAFSDSLGRGSRAIANILFAINLASAALLILLAVWRTRKLFLQSNALEQALNAERERAETTLSSIGQAVLSTDANGRLDYMNPAAERLLRLSAAEARNARLGALFGIVDAESGAADEDFVERILSGQTRGAAPDRRRLVRRDGGTVPVSMVGAPLMAGEAVAGVVIVLGDMTREQEFIDRLSWQASHDELTQIVNRRGFEERLESLFDAPEAGPNAMLFLDLDQFKIVNDTCGHAAGDELLRQVSGLLSRQLRPQDLLARLGGDEFGILLAGSPPDEAAEIAKNLRRAVEKMVFVWNGRSFSVSASIGLVDMSQAGITIEETLRAADVACYMAKEKGRNRVQIHHPSDGELQERVGEMAWVHRIRRALDDDSFTLFSQPIAALFGDDGGHVELLLRLRDPDGGFAPPSSFIPPAERYGLMPLIDRWVVRKAFATIAGRRAARHPDPISTYAINLSGATFGDPDFASFVRGEFIGHGVPPSSICFEITETSAIANLATATSFIASLKRLGCRFSLDDFGSGMSSFAYLKHLPVDYLKIDGGFVKDMLDDRIDRAMVEMIHRIGKLTGKKTIAEFVESDAILEALRDIGVDYAQGYAIARPAPLEESAAIVRTEGVKAARPLRRTA